MKHILIILCLVVMFTAGCGSSNSDTEGVPFINTGVDPDSWAAVPSGDFLKGQLATTTKLWLRMSPTSNSQITLMML